MNGFVLCLVLVANAVSGVHSEDGDLFVEGIHGKKYCPTGVTSIDSEEDCESAAEAMDMSFIGESWMQWFAAGCLIDHELDEVTFNPKDWTSINSLTENYQQICKAESLLPDGCPVGYSQVDKNFDGSGKQLSDVNNINKCGIICEAEAECTGFDYNASSKKCATYTGGMMSGDQLPGWQTCMKGGVDFVKVSNKQCKGKRYDSFDTLDEAKSACGADSDCGAVHDYRCDDKGPFKLCVMDFKEVKASRRGGCFYRKERKNNA